MRAGRRSPRRFKTHEAERTNSRSLGQSFRCCHLARLRFVRCENLPRGPRRSFSHSEYLQTGFHSADSIFRLSKLVLSITGVVFLVVFSLIAYATVKFRRRGNDHGSEPPQVYGSNQVELAWTVIPGLIVLVLFLATARVILSVQDAPKPTGAIEVVAIGHQY